MPITGAYIRPNFTVEWSSGLQEFPYFSRDDYAEQRRAALARYEQERSARPGETVALTRLSNADLEFGDYAPTLLRTSEDPEYEYEGFPERW